MVRSEWSCVFPLRIGNSIGFADCDPSIFAGGNTRALVRLFEPRNNARRFWPVACMCFVVVGECAVKWVLLRCKFYRDIITPIGRIWVIKTAVVSCPSFVPGTCAIRDEIISTWLFADPKDCCNNSCFPRIPSRRPRGGQFSDEGVAFFSDRFCLSKGRITCDEERETKKAKQAAFPHPFRFASRSKIPWSRAESYFAFHGQTITSERRSKNNIFRMHRAPACERQKRAHWD